MNLLYSTFTSTFYRPTHSLLTANPQSAYPEWEAGLWIALAVAGFLFMSGVLRGWRAGGGRRFFSLLGFVLALPAGWFSSGWWPPLLGRILDYPDPVLAFVGGLGCGLAVWMLFALVGSLLFPHTYQVEGLGRRFKYGLSGAFFGALWSAAFIILLAWLIMVGGNVAERVLAFQSVEADSGDTPDDADAQAPRGLVYLVRLNHTLESLPGYSLLERLDPVPARNHRILEKSALVIHDREALERLRQHPDIQSFMEHARFQELAADEEVIELWENRNPHAFLSHPKVRAFTRDPEIRELWQSFDLEQTLDFALGDEGAYVVETPDDKAGGK